MFHQQCTLGSPITNCIQPLSLYFSDLLFLSTEAAVATTDGDRDAGQGAGHTEQEYPAAVGTPAEKRCRTFLRQEITKNLRHLFVREAGTKEAESPNTQGHKSPIYNPWVFLIQGQKPGEQLTVFRYFAAALPLQNHCLVVPNIPTHAAVILRNQVIVVCLDITLI